MNNGGSSENQDTSGYAPELRNKQIIDSHLHLALVIRNHPGRISWMSAHGVLPISWAFCPGVKDRSGLVNCLTAQAELVRDLNRTGLKCFYLAGIHPRSIPPDLTTGEVADILMPYLEDPLCLGMGEIGLETGLDVETGMLRAQLALSESLIAMDKRIGIHTPRKNKAAVTRLTLAVLDEFPKVGPITVIDHCTTETIDRVLEGGYRAGITLSPVKMSIDDLQRIVVRQAGQLDAERLARIMCNTDSGVMFYEDLVDFYGDISFPVDQRNGLAFQNAFDFFHPPE